MAGHICYLSEDLMLLSLLNTQVDLKTKTAILRATRETNRQNDAPKLVQVNMATVQLKTLDDFIFKSSRNLFKIVGLPDGSLGEDPDSWNSQDDFKAGEAIVKGLAVTNNHAERGVALVQDAALVS
jgi:hypothetical protein